MTFSVTTTSTVGRVAAVAGVEEVARGSVAVASRTPQRK
jgi:hypothetical protein